MSDDKAKKNITHPVEGQTKLGKVKGQVKNNPQAQIRPQPPKGSKPKK